MLPLLPGRFSTTTGWPRASLSLGAMSRATMSGPPAGATATPNGSEKPSKKKSTSKRKRKTYTVKAGDTLSGIAEKTDVSLETLRDLNPRADTLSPGQKLRLSR